MQVEILQPHKRLDARVGKVVEIAPGLGNHLATLGVVRVIRHDPARGPACPLVHDDNARRILAARQEQTGDGAEQDGTAESRGDDSPPG